MKKKIGAFGARQFSLETLVGGRPGTTIFQNPGGGGGGGCPQCVQRLHRPLEGVARTVCAPYKVSIYPRYHPKASSDHPQAFGITGQSGLRWASSPGTIT